ncbi:MAG: carboxymuconolactone decarboxylase family protein [Rhodomicrobium sp.]|nr:carboxymuconolactone decarboxylase family protein [Rhodomicrobium sp.]
MPRITPTSADQTDPETAATLAAVKAKIGMVPNLYATFAVAPAVLRAYLAANESLSNGRLSARQREIVALASAQINQCQYCLSAHTLLGEGAGLSAEAIAAARSGRAEGHADNAVAALTTRLMNSRGMISDSELAEAHAAGLDDGLILEVIAHVAMNALTNFTNNVAGTVIDFPVVSIDQQHRAA